MSLHHEDARMQLLGALYGQISMEADRPGAILGTSALRRLEAMRWAAGFLRDNNFLTDGDVDKCTTKIDEIRKRGGA